MEKQCGGTAVADCAGALFSGLLPFAPFDDGDDAVLGRTRGAGMLVVEPPEAKTARDEADTAHAGETERLDAEWSEGVAARGRESGKPTDGTGAPAADFKAFEMEA